MLIFFKSRSKARIHAATLKSNGKPASVSESVKNVTGSRYAVQLAKPINKICAK